MRDVQSIMSLELGGSITKLLEQDSLKRNPEQLARLEDICPQQPGHRYRMTLCVPQRMQALKQGMIIAAQLARGNDSYWV